MSDSPAPDETAALLARADRLLARHHGPLREVPVLTDTLASGDGIPVLTDVVEISDGAQTGTPPPVQTGPGVEPACADAPPGHANREENGSSLDQTLHAQMKKLHARDGGEGGATPPV